jgi:hypothetical protein
MKMTATIELEFESVGETTHNAMDAALIRGLEVLKKGIELREDGTPRRSIKPDSTKWNIVQRIISLAPASQANDAIPTTMDR